MSIIDDYFMISIVYIAIYCIYDFKLKLSTNRISIWPSKLETNSGKDSIQESSNRI